MDFRGKNSTKISRLELQTRESYKIIIEVMDVDNISHKEMAERHKEKTKDRRNLRREWGREKEQIKQTQHVLRSPASPACIRPTPCTTQQTPHKNQSLHLCIISVRPKMVFLTFLTSHFLSRFPTLHPYALTPYLQSHFKPWKWSAQHQFSNINFVLLSPVSVWTLHLTISSANLRANPIMIRYTSEYRALQMPGLQVPRWTHE